MKLAPETLMYIRDAMKYGGALLVSLGAIGAQQAMAAEALTAIVISLLQAIGGLALAGYATVLAWKAKQAASREAQIIAGRVISDPEAHVISPPPKES